MKKKPQVKQTKVTKPVSNANEIITYQVALEKLIQQRTELSVKIDELNNKISEVVTSNVTMKLNKFFKTLSEEEINALNRTDLFADIFEEFLQEEYEESFKD